MEKRKSSYNYPLAIIGGFLGISEAFVLYGVTRTSGTLQWVLLGTAILIIFGTGIFFFITLWKKPYLFYPPSEYSDDVRPNEYIQAMQGTIGSKSDSEGKIKVSQEIIPILSSQNEESDIKSNEETKSHEENKQDIALNLFFQKKYLEARIEFQKLIAEETDPEKTKNLKNLSAYILSFYDFNKSIEEFNNLINGSSDYSSYFWYTEIFSRLKQYKSAIEIVDKGINSTDDVELKQSLLLLKINNLIDNKEDEKAEEILLEFVKDAKDPKQKAEAFRKLARNYFRKNEPQDANSFLFSAYKTDPTNYENVADIAAIFYDQGNHQIELYFRLEAVKLDENVNSLGLLGNCYLNNNLNNLAIHSYSRADELAENKASWILGNIGNLYKNLGLYNMALSYLNKALELDPEDQYAQNRLSESLTNIKQEKEKVDQILKDISF